MGISSYAMLLDEYSEHNFCTSSSSSKAFGFSVILCLSREAVSRITNKQQITLLLLF